MAEKYNNIKHPIRDDWTWSLIKDVVLISSGKTPKGINDVKLKPESDIDFYKVSDMNAEGNEKYMVDSALKVTLSEASSLKLKLEEPRTIIFPKRGGAILTNKKRILSKKSAYDLNLMGVKEKSEIIENRFLWFWFQKLDLSSIYDGSNVPQINNKNIEPLWFPVAPLSEQRAIVSKIEQLFSDLDNGIENFKKAQEQLKIYRQAVLKKAFEGELTRKWREEQTDFPSAEELLQQVKKEREKHHQKQLDKWITAVRDWEDGGKEGKKPAKPKKMTKLPPLTEDNLTKLSELPERWKWVKTSEIIFPINNGYTPKANYLFQDEGEIPFIKVYNLNFDGTLNFKLNPTFTTKEIHNNDLKRSICYPDDVLINIVGPPLGKVSIVPNIFPEWNINQAIVLFRPNNFINSKYLSYFHQNPMTIAWLKNTSKATAGQFNVKVSTCREIPFPLSSIKEQSQIVQEIETRLSICDKMEETIAESLQKAESLRQSILKKAFEGKLLNEKELEEVRNSPDWEPAGKLLERIKAEKTNIEVKNKGKK